MNVAPDKIADAHFVLLISNIVAAVGLVNISYQGLLDAFEKFGQMALVDILNAFIKLEAVICLLHYEGNALRFYALIMSLLTAVSFICYHYICYRRYHDIICHRWYCDRSLYHDIIVFNNYTALGAQLFLLALRGLLC
ncbi:MAG: hypothetical protein LUE99_08775 [Bacteroides sp.]|nr:hypothetical protein [Bacteroides sp.]